MFRREGAGPSRRRTSDVETSVQKCALGSIVDARARPRAAYRDMRAPRENRLGAAADVGCPKSCDDATPLYD